MINDSDEKRNQADRPKKELMEPIFDTTASSLTDSISNDRAYMESVLNDYNDDLKGILDSIDSYKSTLEKASKKK